MPPRIAVSHGSRSASRRRLRQHGEAREPGQDESPQEQRARLRAPQRRELVDRRQRARRVVGDLLEAEVVAQDRDPQHDRRRSGPPRTRREPRAPPPSRSGDRAARRRTSLPRPRSRPRGVPGSARRGRGAPRCYADAAQGLAGCEIAFCDAVYFDGQRVLSESFTATNVPFSSLPSTSTDRPVRNASGRSP